MLNARAMGPPRFSRSATPTARGGRARPAADRPAERRPGRPPGQAPGTRGETRLPPPLSILTRAAAFASAQTGLPQLYAHIAGLATAASAPLDPFCRPGL